MNLQSFIRLTEKPANKYRNQKIKENGLTFDSKKEYYRYCDLKLLERAGVVSDIQRQVKFELIPKQEGERAVTYVADFVYRDKQGKTIVEDTKGVRTKEYIIKRKLMLWRYGIKILEV